MNIYYVMYLDFLLVTNDNLWFQSKIYTYNKFSQYLLYIFLIFFKYIFSLFFIICSVINYLFYRLAFFHPIFLELPEFFFKFFTGNQKNLYQASSEFTEKMLQVCMDFYSQKTSFQILKPNPFSKI